VRAEVRCVYGVWVGTCNGQIEDGSAGVLCVSAYHSETRPTQPPDIDCAHPGLILEEVSMVRPRRPGPDSNLVEWALSGTYDADRPVSEDRHLRKQFD